MSTSTEAVRAWRKANPERYKAREKEYCQMNSQRAVARVSAWRKANPEKYRAQQQRSRAKNPEYGKTYRLQNAEKLAAHKKQRRLENLEQYKTRNRQSKQRHRAKVLAGVKLRKARQKRATPPWLTDEHRKHMQQLYVVAATLSGYLGPHHVDHIVPLNSPIVCGLHVPWNLQILPAAKNIEKSNRTWPHAP